MTRSFPTAGFRLERHHVMARRRSRASLGSRTSGLLGGPFQETGYDGIVVTGKPMPGVSLDPRRGGGDRDGALTGRTRWSRRMLKSQTRTGQRR